MYNVLQGGKKQMDPVGCQRTTVLHEPIENSVSIHTKIFVLPIWENMLTCIAFFLSITLHGQCTTVSLHFWDRDLNYSNTHTKIINYLQVEMNQLDKPLTAFLKALHNTGHQVDMKLPCIRGGADDWNTESQWLFLMLQRNLSILLHF